jgi:tetratricopeptide (TPR) repeat protein
LFLHGERELAVEELQRALAEAPEDDLALFLMGVWLEDRGRGDEAREYYRRALAVNPEHGGAAHYLANRLMLSGDYGRAAEHYRTVVEQFPDNEPAWMMLALALIRADPDHRRAVAVLEEGMAGLQQPVLLRSVLARLLAASPDERVRDGGRAREIAAALFAGANNLDNAETLAMAYAEDGDYGLAVKQQRKIIEAAKGAWRFDVVPRLEANLARYEAGEPCREPWASDDPVFRPAPVDAYMTFREYPTRRAY